MKYIWQQVLPIHLWWLTSPCKAALAFVILWLGMIAITWARLSDTSLVYRMDIAARTLTYSGTSDLGLKPNEAIEKAIIEPSANFRFWSLPGDPKAMAEQSKAGFLHEVQVLSKLDEKKLEFSKEFDKLDPLSKALSDSQPMARPTILRRLLFSYYSIDGVHFRRLDDLSRVRDLAVRYLDFRGRHNIPTGLDELFRPWSIFEFYDPKRSELNDFLPFVFALLMLVNRFLLSYLYYDVTCVRRGRQTFIKKKRIDWIQLWETDLVDENDVIASMGYFWPIFLSISGFIGVVIELALNDPEVWPERLLNVPLMLASCCLVALLLMCLFSLAASTFTKTFQGYGLRFRGRVLFPLVIALGPGVLAITFWVSLFSWRRLCVFGYSAMEIRGWIQLALSLIIELLAIFVLWRIFYGAPGTGSGKPDNPKNNPPEPGCLARIGVSTDEKLIVSLALVLIPWAKAILS